MKTQAPGLLRAGVDADVVMMIGMAGHVDHGKTSLVKLLTGCNTDRLKAEQERGMTIDLGFAPCLLGGQYCVGIVDVPGHERFIRNMVAGVSGIDLAVLVVAADDGIMPQTIEAMNHAKAAKVGMIDSGRATAERGVKPSSARTRRGSPIARAPRGYRGSPPHSARPASPSPACSCPRRSCAGSWRRTRSRTPAAATARRRSCRSRPPSMRRRATHCRRRRPSAGSCATSRGVTPSSPPAS
jgi:hypothetical protein